MHDSQIEDRLRAVLRAEGDTLPLTITPDELVRRLALRRRERSGRRLSLMAAGLAIIAVGSIVAMTAGWIRIPGAGSELEPSVQLLETPRASLGPAATPLAGIAPLVGTPGRMELIRIDPAGPTDGANGTATAPASGTSVVTSLSCVGDGNLEIAIDGSAQGMGCSSFLSESPGVWFDVADGQVDLTYSATGSISFALLIERPGEGESPPTGSASPCDQIDPSLSPEPPSIAARVTPGDSIGLRGTTSAFEWNGTAVGAEGSWEGLPAVPDSIVVNPETEAIEIVSDECLYEVTSESLLTVYAEVPDPSPRPAELPILRGVGTRIVDIQPPAVGGMTVRVRASFATTDGSTAWSETLFRVFVPFEPPTLEMSQGAGMDYRAAKGRCPSYQLASGASAADGCGAPYEPITDTAPLVVPWADGPFVNTLDFTLTDFWRIDQARITAVRADLVRAGSFAPEYSVAVVDQGGLSLAIPIPLDPGSWILRVSLNGSRGGDKFGAYYDLPLQVGP